jgi:hypothetical protein
MRENLRESVFESVEIIKVFARPGTPTSRQLPPENSAIKSSWMTLFCPMMTLAISSCRVR